MSSTLHNFQSYDPVIRQCTRSQSIAFQGTKEADVQFSLLCYEQIDEQISERPQRVFQQSWHFNFWNLMSVWTYIGYAVREHLIVKVLRVAVILF